MHCEDRRTAEIPTLWALEPAVTPLPARWAVALGILLALGLVLLSSGEAEVSHLEEWHGNVALSHSLQPQVQSH